MSVNGASQNPPGSKPCVPEHPGTWLAFYDTGWCLNVMAGAGTRQEVKDTLRAFCTNAECDQPDKVGEGMNGYMTIYKVHKL